MMCLTQEEQEELRDILFKIPSGVTWFERGQFAKNRKDLCIQAIADFFREKKIKMDPEEYYEEKKGVTLPCG